MAARKTILYVFRGRRIAQRMKERIVSMNELKIGVSLVINKKGFWFFKRLFLSRLCYRVIWSESILTTYCVQPSAQFLPDLQHLV
jgi:fucose 4-O-acetylase-like acetyltransferase